MAGEPHQNGIRRYARMNVDITVRVLPKDTRPTFGRGHDISCGGMALYAPVELQESELVKLAFELPNSRVQFNVSAVVKNRNGFRYGVEFVELAPQELKEIKRVTEILALVRH